VRNRRSGVPGPVCLIEGVASRDGASEGPEVGLGQSHVELLSGPLIRVSILLPVQKEDGLSKGVREHPRPEFPNKTTRSLSAESPIATGGKSHRPRAGRREASR